MPDPFAFFTDPTQSALGIAPPAPTPQPKPAAPVAPVAAPPRTAASTMIAPPTPAPAPMAAPAAPERAGERPSPPSSVDQFMHLVRAHESGGNDKASSGVANGRYQFTPSTWAGVARNHPELGLHPNDIWDGAKQDLAMRAITRDYQSVLSAQGIPATMPNMFMLHFLGTGGGPKFLHQMAANPNANAAAAFPLEAQYNPTIFHDKAGQPRTLSQVYSLMTKTFGGPGAPPVDTHTASAPAGEGAAIASFDKAAGVPTTPQGFVEGRASAESASNALPPPPPGVTLRAQPKASSLPPPPPGVTLKLDLKSDKPLTQAGVTDEKGYHAVEAPKPAAPADPKKSLAEVEGYDPAPPGAMGTVGEPRFADPKGQQEYDKRSQEIDKGVLAGMAQDVTGPASLLPNWLGGGAAERANTALDKTGDPTARKIGSALPMLAPIGEVGAAAKAGGKALEAGESLIPSMLKGAGWSAGAGAANASSHPTGSDTMGGRWAGKAPGMAEEGLISGLIGGALPGAATGLKWLYSEAGNLKKFISDAFGKKAEAAREELRSGVKAETGKVMTAEERKIAEAKVEEGAARARQVTADAELKRITDAQAQLAERERVRAAEGRDVRQVDDPKVAEKLREGVTARARERVRQAEDQAKSAGASEAQAKEYAVEQEQKVLGAKTAAQEITAAAKSGEQMSKEKFGDLVQKAADDLETAAEEAREKAAGFKEAMRTAPPGPAVKNAGVMKVLDDIDTSSADRNVQAITNEVRRQFVTTGRDAEGKLAVVDKDGITVERADSLRKVLNTAMRSRTMAVEGGAADASAAQHHIRAVLKALEDATGEAHPPYNAAVEAWRKNSRGPLDEFLPKQALGKITKAEDFSGGFAMSEGRVVNEILSQSNDGSEALATLARENPEIVNATEKYLNRQLIGLDGKNTLTPKAVTSFMEKNESTLKKLGLYEKYEKMRDALTGAGKEVEGAEAAAKAAKTDATQAEAQRRALEKVADSRRSVLKRSKKEQPGDVFSPASENLKDAAKPAADKAADDTARLKAQREAPETARKQAVSELADAASKQKAARDIQEHLAKLDNKLDPKVARTGPEVTQEANKTADWLKDKGYLDAAAHKDLLTKIREVEQMSVDSASAAKRVKQILIAAAVLGLGATGAEIGRVVSHRVTP